jgi:hypothetical protein
VLPEKVQLAHETFRVAQVEKTINLVEGDARVSLPQFENIAFCFLDAEKEVYGDCYEAIIPKLVKGGLLIADNAINHQETLKPMLDRALADERVDAVDRPDWQRRTGMPQAMKILLSFIGSRTCFIKSHELQEQESRQKDWSRIMHKRFNCLPIKQYCCHVMTPNGASFYQVLSVRLAPVLQSRRAI